MVSSYSAEDHAFALCAYGENIYLEQCIDSLLNQSARSRIIIFTSTPNEHIADLAEKYDLPLVVHRDAKGIDDDWNFAYEHTDAKLVTLAHQYDIYYPDYLKEILKHANSSDDPMIVFTAYHERQFCLYTAGHDGSPHIRRISYE